MFRWITRRRDNDPPLSEADRRDLQLSAYLDGDLPAADHDALQTALDTDPELNDALDGMRQVRDSLASLQTVRAPRSFAIEASPASAPARSGFGRFELVARFGAVAAAVAFAAVLFGDFSNSATTSFDSADAGGGTVAERSATHDQQDGCRHLHGRKPRPGLGPVVGGEAQADPHVGRGPIVGLAVASEIVVVLMVGVLLASGLTFLTSQFGSAIIRAFIRM